MRTLILATLLVAGAGCGTTHQQQVQNTDSWSSSLNHQRPPDQPPVNVSRSTESGPSGAAAGVGR